MIKPASLTSFSVLPIQVDNESKGGAKGKDVEGGKERGGTRQNFDKRTARMKNAKHFKVAIASYRDENAHVLFHQDARNKGGNNGAAGAGGGLVNCYVRKRPLFDYEAVRGEYDVVSVCKGGGDKRGALLIHNCVMHPDMKVRMTVASFVIESIQCFTFDCCEACHFSGIKLGTCCSFLSCTHISSLCLLACNIRSACTTKRAGSLRKRPSTRPCKTWKCLAVAPRL